MKTEERHWAWTLLEFLAWLVTAVFVGLLGLCLATLPKAKK